MPSDIRSREPLEEDFQSPFQDKVNEKPKVRLPGHPCAESSDEERGDERRLQGYQESVASIASHRMVR